MLEADMAMTQHAFGNNTYGDERLHVVFQMHPHPNNEASAKEGRPVFEEREYVKIMVPGDKYSVVIRPVWQQDKLRFPRQYAAFKEGRSQDSIGTPLAMWPQITRSQVEELAYFNCKTIEQLANMPDSNIQNFAGILSLRQKARDFIKYAKESAPIAELRKELDEKDAKIAAQDEAIRELGGSVRALQAAQNAERAAQVPAKAK